MDEAPTIIPSPLADVSPLVDILTEQSPSAQLLASASSKGYLSHLSTLPLTELVQEPTSLQTQSHHLTSSLTSFTHTSYPTFISLHKTTTDLASSIETLSSSLDQLLDKSLPALEATTEVWKGRTEAVLRERDKARVVLEQHEKIRDLLDIPVLIDTCVRNGYFGEALSLASHVSALIHKANEKKDKSPPAILTSVRSEVQHSIAQMHLSLLATLYEPNRKLPALWKAVNFLRKMDAFGSGFAVSVSHFKTLQSPRKNTFLKQKSSGPSSEEQLALAFLSGRESCLKIILETTGRDIRRLVKQVTAGEIDSNPGAIDRSDSQLKATSKGVINELDDREKEDLARYLKKYIDAWREGVYDIVTQFATIFLERSSTHPETQTNINDEDLLSRLHTLLRTYSTRALSTHLFAIVKPAFPLLTLSHLPSLITQLNYCSTAFARLGLDFRYILTSMFSTAILSIVQRDLETAANKWIERVEKARGTMHKNRTRTTSASSTRVSIGPTELPSKWLILPSLVDSPPVPLSSKHQVPSSSGPPHIPPQILASYPPLAELTNAVLGVLNGLRLVVPRGHTTVINGSASDTNVTAEGVHELLNILDNIILTRGANVLLEYFHVVTLAFTVDDGNGAEQQREREKEERVVVASGHVFFDVFSSFVRRGLVEGVYGVKVDVLEKGKAKAKDTEGVSEHEESWLEKRVEFQMMAKALGGEESEEEESEEEGEEEEEEEDQSGESGDDDDEEGEGEEGS